MTLQHPHLRVIEGQLTRAEVNAGKVVVTAQAHRAITVVDAWMRAIGGAAVDTTSVDIVDSATGTVAVAFGVDALTENTIVRPGDSHVTATNLGTALGTGEGLKVVNTGTALATATAMDYCIKYVVEGTQLSA